MHYYTIVKSHEKANALVNELEKDGIKPEQINIIMKSGTTEDTTEMKKEDMLNTDVTLDEAPKGAVGVIGSVGAAATGILTGLGIVIAGPVAGVIAGGAAATASAAALLTNLGVPEKHHEEYMDKLHMGDILIQVYCEDQPDIAHHFSQAA